MKANATKTNPRSSRARPAPTSRRTASGGPAAADVAADAAGAVGRRTVLPDRSPTNSDRPAAPEASSAVADFDGDPAEPSQPVIQPESFATAPHEQPSVDHGQPEPARTTMAAEAESAQEAEKAAARRRSTVREKVSFLADAPPAAPSPASQSPSSRQRLPVPPRAG